MRPKARMNQRPTANMKVDFNGQQFVTIESRKVLCGQVRGELK